MNHDSKFVYPDFYNSLVNVPHSILKHFNIYSDKPPLNTPLLQQIKDCSKIILFVLDGFGYNLFKKDATLNPFFKKIDTNNFATKITSVFPSTTTAGITTINTGLSPREHALMKWNLYLPSFDAVIQPLPYKVVQTEHQKHAVSIPHNTNILFEDKTIYEYLAEAGIPSYYFIPKQLKETVYVRAMSKGAKIIPYISITDLFIMLHKTLEQTQGKAYFFVYWGVIDAQEHFYGPESLQAKAEIYLFDKMIQDEFINKLSKQTLEDSALLITADHGQSTINSDETIYLNNYPEITNNFKRSKNGTPIPPTGNPRDAFLHIDESKVDETLEKLEEKFGNIADIIKLDKEAVINLFGTTTKEHPEFYERLGNILILPKGEKAIWYRYLPNQKIEYKGHHGGLTKDEMYIPFIASKLSNLF